jgi:hypothetical protein
MHYPVHRERRFGDGILLHHIKTVPNGKVHTTG